MIKLLNQNHFPTSPVYKKRQSKLKKEILKIHEVEVQNILNDRTLDDIQDDDLYDFLFLEKELFKPLSKPRL